MPPPLRAHEDRAAASIERLAETSARAILARVRCGVHVEAHDARRQIRQSREACFGCCREPLFFLGRQWDDDAPGHVDHLAAIQADPVIIAADIHDGSARAVAAEPSWISAAMITGSA